jgi:hypothetical protein
VTDGSSLPFIERGGQQDDWPFSVRTTGSVDVQLQWLKYKPPLDDEGMGLEFLRRLNEVPGIDIAQTSITKLPPVHLAPLTGPGALSVFLRVLEWVVMQIEQN